MYFKASSNVTAAPVLQEVGTRTIGSHRVTLVTVSLFLIQWLTVDYITQGLANFAL